MKVREIISEEIFNVLGNAALWGASAWMAVDGIKRIGHLVRNFRQRKDGTEDVILDLISSGIVSDTPDNINRLREILDDPQRTEMFLKHLHNDMRRQIHKVINPRFDKLNLQSRNEVVMLRNQIDALANGKATLDVNIKIMDLFDDIVHILSKDKSYK